MIQHASDKSESVEQWVLHTEGNKSRFPYLEQVRPAQQHGCPGPAPMHPCACMLIICRSAQPNDRAYNASSAAPAEEEEEITGGRGSPAGSSMRRHTAGAVNSAKPPSGRYFVATPASIFGSRPSSAAAPDGAVPRTVLSSSLTGARVTYHGSRGEPH